MLRDMVLYIFYIKSGAEVLSIRWVFQMIMMLNMQIQCVKNKSKPLKAVNKSVQTR